jgi:cation transport regulator
MVLLRTCEMPYATNADLPASVRAVLPRRVQDIYREAFNHAWREYWVDESVAHRIAWSTVKRSYHRDATGNWVRSNIQGDWSRRRHGRAA